MLHYFILYMWMFVTLEYLPHTFSRALTYRIPSLPVLQLRSHVVQTQFNNRKARAHYVYDEIGIQVLAHLINIYRGTLYNYPRSLSLGHLKRDLPYIRELLQHFYRVRVCFIYNYYMVRECATFKQHWY
jgi:hypothetical protein